MTGSNYRKEKQTYETKGPSFELQDPREGEAGNLIIESNDEVGVIQHSGDCSSHATNAEKHKNMANEEEMH